MILYTLLEVGVLEEYEVIMGTHWNKWELELNTDIDEVQPNSGKKREDNL